MSFAVSAFASAFRPSAILPVDRSFAVAACFAGRSQSIMSLSDGGASFTFARLSSTIFSVRFPGWPVQMILPSGPTSADDG